MRLLLALPLATFFTIIFAGPQKLEPVVFDEEGWIKETHSDDPAIEEYSRVRRSNGIQFYLYLNLRIFFIHLVNSPKLTLRIIG